MFIVLEIKTEKHFKDVLAIRSHLSAGGHCQVSIVKVSPPTVVMSKSESPREPEQLQKFCIRALGFGTAGTV